MSLTTDGKFSTVELDYSCRTHEYEALKREKNELAAELNQVRDSLAWVLMGNARALREAMFKDGTRRGKYWVLVSRFMKTAIRSGMKAAVRKALERVKRKLGGRPLADSDLLSELESTVVPDLAPGGRFRELPWRILGSEPQDESRKSGHFKLLLVAHSACRTGAPLCFLQLAQELSRVADFDCHVVLQQDGELADSFARLASRRSVSTT